MRQLEALSKMGELSPGTVAAGAAGGIGAYALAHSILNPTIAMQEEAVRRAASSLTKTKMIPLAVGAIGALLIGMLAASKARRDERAKMQQQAYPHGGQGYVRGEQVAPNTPESLWYQ